MATATQSRPVVPDWHDAWRKRSDDYQSAVPELAVSGEFGLRHELIFCLLGGHGVSFELALSATDVVMALCPFESFWSPAHLEQALCRALSAAQFDPRRKDGEFRRYRYPNRKAGLVVKARDWVLECGDLSSRLEEIDSENERRNWLCCCPGIGPKSASWLLRNTGYAERLAILDVHILRAMREAGRLPPMQLPRDYQLVESRFVEWCDELGASVAALDLFLWEWQRGNLGPYQ
jgi:thermostable 8-oxoguanine DNA glycosylase